MPKSKQTAKKRVRKVDAETFKDMKFEVRVEVTGLPKGTCHCGCDCGLECEIHKD